MAQPAREGAVEGGASDWGQVVTRYPYENVGMDHLLSKEKDETKTSLELCKHGRSKERMAADMQYTHPLNRPRRPVWFPEMTPGSF